MVIREPHLDNKILTNKERERESVVHKWSSFFFPTPWIVNCFVVYTGILPVNRQGWEANCFFFLSPFLFRWSPLPWWLAATFHSSREIRERRPFSCVAQFFWMGTTLKWICTYRLVCVCVCVCALYGNKILIGDYIDIFERAVAIGCWLLPPVSLVDPLKKNNNNWPTVHIYTHVK